MSSDKTWNPRYVAFAAATRMEPGARLEHDQARRTGRMTDFILWIGEQWAAWGGPRPPQRTPDDHKNFDLWLAAKYLRGRQMELEFAAC